MSQFNTPAYDIERPTGRCAFTGQELEPGDRYVATLIDLTAAAIDAQASEAQQGDQPPEGQSGDDQSGDEQAGDKPQSAGDQQSAAQPEAGQPETGQRETGQRETSAKSKSQVGLKRLDVSLEAWDRGDRPDHLFSFWVSTVPQPNEKKRLFVDDDVLVDLFRRLGDEDQQHRAAFRFVLGLILMRKKKLRFLGSEIEPGEAGKEDLDVWLMQPIPKPQDEQPLRMVNPHMDEAQVQAVSAELGEILDSDFAESQQ